MEITTLTELMRKNVTNKERMYKTWLQVQHVTTRWCYTALRVCEKTPVSTELEDNMITMETINMQHKMHIYVG